MVLSMEDISWKIFGDECVGHSVWTQQLQDPLHREEQETCFTLSMDWEKQNIWVLLIRVLEWGDHTCWATGLQQNIAQNI